MSESCNAINDLSNLIIWLCVPNKTEDLNLIVLNINTGINESKVLEKIFIQMEMGIWWKKV